ncbi:MAG: metal ABC transporter permease [Phycisphaeraceae bacterium]|nr:metal ABC transporter permease [Phycisphaeraceae bacterium]MCB9848356.1 metal ABC transporter permease [Phycisphaeraceae bacterium]
MLAALPAAGPDLGEVLEVLTFGAGFNTAIVVAGALLLGMAAGTIGTFSMLRGRALMSDALAHSTLPGVCVGFLVAASLGALENKLPILLACATVTGVLGVLAVQAIARTGRLREDAAIGASLSVFFGIGVVLLSAIQGMDIGGQGGINAFIFGQTAAMLARDAAALGAIAVACALLTALLFKEFRLLCFDPVFASSQGWPVNRIDLAMMALVVAVTVTGLQAVGLILIVALVIIPPATARLWTDRLWRMACLSALFGAMSGYLGASLSALLTDTPAGAVIVLTAGAMYVASLFAAPRRGVIAGVVRRLLLRRTIARQHALRALYESIEAAGAGEPRVPLDALLAGRSWGASELRRALGSLRRSGLCETDARSVRLTGSGLEEARRITRNHRLWEEYLVAFADIAPSHVDHAADLVEHVLDAPLVAQLEQRLRSAGRLPGPSVHPIGAGGGGA